MRARYRNDAIVDSTARSAIGSRRPATPVGTEIEHKCEAL
jgi:hypothetical protein